MQRWVRSQCMACSKYAAVPRRGAAQMAGSGEASLRRRMFCVRPEAGDP